MDIAEVLQWFKVAMMNYMPFTIAKLLTFEGFDEKTIKNFLKHKVRENVANLISIFCCPICLQIQQHRKSQRSRTTQ